MPVFTSLLLLQLFSWKVPGAEIFLKEALLVQWKLAKSHELVPGSWPASCNRWCQCPFLMAETCHLTTGLARRSYSPLATSLETHKFWSLLPFLCPSLSTKLLTVLVFNVYLCIPLCQPLFPTEKTTSPSQSLKIFGSDGNLLYR